MVIAVLMTLWSFRHAKGMTKHINSVKPIPLFLTSEAVSSNVFAAGPFPMLSSLWLRWC